MPFILTAVSQSRGQERQVKGGLTIRLVHGARQDIGTLLQPRIVDNRSEQLLANIVAEILVADFVQDGNLTVINIGTALEDGVDHGEVVHPPFDHVVVDFRKGLSDLVHLPCEVLLETGHVLSALVARLQEGTDSPRHAAVDLLECVDERRCGATPRRRNTLKPNQYFQENSLSSCSFLVTYNGGLPTAQSLDRGHIGLGNPRVESLLEDSLDGPKINLRTVQVLVDLAVVLERQNHVRKRR